ncbi:ABC transporter ATP-binding protein [Massilimicrobiota timonensis]|uniref:ABC transporter ATP-binding protein n=1 Tax=Massilimicrobiota timonensis TaxID=1776392 RepID=UPI00196053B5|nr:ABC transporter ATP-binding protein [Massilimicrobiota timonensis]MBM6966655.1 ABC transporter ATP-binding protein [Massilimicrobiota timonensis]
MENKKKGSIMTLLDYAGNYKVLTFIGLVLSAISMLCSIVPYVCIWLVARDLIGAMPDYLYVQNLEMYGWVAFGFAIIGIIFYFIGLLCTHLSAFRTAENIRKIGMNHIMKAPLGYFDNNASGLIRGRLDSGANDTETLLAHNLADIVGTIVLFIGMVILMFVFDWRMGLTCLLSAVISILMMFSMMGGKNAKIMAEYQAAQDKMTKAGTEYVRGIPVVKIFQQTVYSFKSFQQAIEEYSDKAEYYQGKVCRVPQSINLTFTEGAFIFLIPVVILLIPEALNGGKIHELVTNFIFYAVFSAIISTALAKIMFASSGIMLANTALSRIDMVMKAPILEKCINPQMPKDNSVAFKDVSFTYQGSNIPALSHVSFQVESGQTIALVGPSGGGKTTAASLIPRFWDVDEGIVEVGHVNVKNIDQHVLMNQVAFVFQNTQLFKTSILNNVKIANPQASDEDVIKALQAARCQDIIEKLPDGVHTQIGKEGTYLSGGEQQRIALARAILKNAPIVVLDEATAFADPENEVLIQKALSVLCQDKTVIMIAHRLSTVVNADKIIVLKDGKIIEEGRHKELLNKEGLYHKMWNNYNQSVKWKITSGKEGI